MSFRQNIFSIFSFLFISIASLNAQEDKIEKKKTIKINAKTTPIKAATLLDINATNGFKNAYKNTQSKYKKIAAEKALLNKGIITPEMLKNQQLKKNLERGNLKIPMIDKDLGSFKTKSENINIMSSDFGSIDGDVISIYKNGKLIIEIGYDQKYKVIDFLKEKNFFVNKIIKDYGNNVRCIVSTKIN